MDTWFLEQIFLRSSSLFHSSLVILYVLSPPSTPYKSYSFILYLFVSNGTGTDLQEKRSRRDSFVVTRLSSISVDTMKLREAERKAWEDHSYIQTFLGYERNSKKLHWYYPAPTYNGSYFIDGIISLVFITTLINSTSIIVNRLLFRLFQAPALLLLLVSSVPFLRFFVPFN